MDGLIWRMERAPVGPSGLTLSQELGYPKDARLLVINSDDTAGHPTFTAGIQQVMPAGIVLSTSVIVNDRNEAELREVAALSQAHPEWSVGVHLTLTNEYQHRHPWAPVLPQDRVPSLYNGQGLAWASIEELQQHARPDEVEQELRAQIDKALAAGIDVTHLDSHMGTVYRESFVSGVAPDGLTQAAIRVADAYNIPLTMNTFDQRLEPNMAHMDALMILRPDTFFGFYELAEMNQLLGYEGPAPQRWTVAWFVRQSLGFQLPYQNDRQVKGDVAVRAQIVRAALSGVTKPGLNHFFMHAANEDIIGQQIPAGLNHADWVDRVVRLGDSAVWSDPDLLAELERDGFILVNYKQVRDVQRRWRRSQ